MDVSILRIKATVEALLDWVRQDLIDNIAEPEFSWLYLTFGDVGSDGQNFYEQLKYILERGNDDRTNLLVRLMFDKDRANLPTIHIHYPSEDGRSGDNTLNTGASEVVEVNGKLRNLYSRSFIGNYDLVVTGGNSLEVVMLYEFLDAILIAAADTLASQFSIFTFSGKQLLPNQDIIPHLTFFRAIGLTLQEKKVVHSIISMHKLNDINFTGSFTNNS